MTLVYLYLGAWALGGSLLATGFVGGLAKRRPWPFVRLALGLMAFGGAGLACALAAIAALHGVGCAVLAALALTGMAYALGREEISAAG